MGNKKPLSIDCQAIIDDLAKQGITLELNEKAQINAIGPITSELEQRVRSNKLEIIKLLKDDWMPVQDPVYEDPNMYVSPLHDYDLKAARVDYDIAKMNLEYIAEDLERSVKLSKNAERYLAHCLRKVLGSKKPEPAFNLVRPKFRPKTTVKRNIEMMIEYRAPGLNDKQREKIRDGFAKIHGIKPSSFTQIRAEHGPFCKSYAERKQQYELDPGKDAALEKELAEYIEECNNKKKTRKKTKS